MLLLDGLNANISLSISMDGKKSAASQHRIQQPMTASTPESLSTQRLPQKPNLPISILFKQRPSIRIEVFTRKHVQLLWLASFPVRLQRNVSRAKHVVVRHDHQQWSRRDAVDHV
jgi:hypothetical protein